MTSPYDDVILATTGLVGYWPLDEAAGTNADDKTGTGNDGTLVNTPTLSVDLGFAAGDDGMTFAAASSERVTIPNHATYQFGTGDYSMELWFYRSGDPSTEEMLLNRGTATDHGFEMYLGDGGAYLNSRIGGVIVYSAFPGWSWGGIWHHGVTTMDRDGNGIVYIDGALSGSWTISTESAQTISESATTYIGSDSSGGKYLTGGVAKVALYNVALSAGTVAAHYAARNATASSGSGGSLIIGGGLFP